MWPWGHAAIGYLALYLVTAIRRREPPTKDEAIIVLIATQIPDLIDKPLAWQFGILSNGRSFAHSMVTATVMIAIAWYVARRYDVPSLPLPFSIGYVSAILTDVPLSVFSGDLSSASFLLWPLLPSPEYSTDPSFGAHLLKLSLTDWVLFQSGVALLVAVLLLRTHRREIVEWLRLAHSRLPASHRKQ